MARLQTIRSHLAPPEGAFVIGAGCVVSGVAAYLFLLLTARSLGPIHFAPLAQLWTLALLLAPGTFLTVEQEVTRAVRQRAAQGVAFGSVIRRTGKVGALICAVWAIAVLASAPLLLSRLFDHQTFLLVGLLASLPSYLAIHLTWGALAGARRFASYAILMGAEGVVRLLLGCGLLAANVRSPGPYGIVVGIAPLAIVLLSGWGNKLGAEEQGPEYPWREAFGHIGQLLAGSILNQGLLLAPPLALGLLATEAERPEASKLVVALVLIRIPLFLFNAILVSTLADLAGKHALPDRGEFRRALRQLLATVAAIITSSTATAVVLGPGLIRLLFGRAYSLGALDVGLLAGACGAFMFAVAMGQALIASTGHLKTTAAWAVGLASFAVALLVPGALLLRVELAFVAGCTAAALSMAALILDDERRRSPAVVVGYPGGTVTPFAVDGHWAER